MKHVLLPVCSSFYLQAAERFSQSAWERVNEQYCILSRAVDDSEGAAASTDLVTLSQPWTVSSLTCIY